MLTLPPQRLLTYTNALLCFALAAEMSCSCSASFLKLWSAFPCAIILLQEILKAHLVCYTSAAFLYFTTSSYGSARGEVWSLQFLLAGTSCVLPFGLRPLPCTLVLEHINQAATWRTFQLPQIQTISLCFPFCFFLVLLPVSIPVFLVEGRKEHKDTFLSDTSPLPCLFLCPLTKQVLKRSVSKSK